MGHDPAQSNCCCSAIDHCTPECISGSQLGDTMFVYGDGLMAYLFTLMIVVMVVDGVQDVTKWLPKKMPSSHDAKKNSDEAIGISKASEEDSKCDNALKIYSRNRDTASLVN
ncbi:expressed unknown protein [Seminavis robusta]|uniref:Uncharacterized protein n=1 Tax=Seminavis robusta TaxID=568900 RepID=A0A9N8HHX9_9STRA|nr:expressed unknown protein [Seminavis robusta]|eukprot:Sro665_g183841.1  (112) ;mRNA; f:27138-27473